MDVSELYIPLIIIILSALVSSVIVENFMTLWGANNDITIVEINEPADSESHQSNLQMYSNLNRVHTFYSTSHKEQDN